MKFLTICFVVSYLLQSSYAIAADYLCSLGDVTLFPCDKVLTPADNGQTVVSYRPTKWIPLWPNHAAFGGSYRSHGMGETEKDNEASDLDTYYNQAQVFTDTKQNIESIPLNLNRFDDSFVDVTLGTLGVSWTGSEWHTLIDASKTFRGEEIYKGWLNATTRGVVCAKFIKNDLYNKNYRECAFARKIENERSRSPNGAEYCFYYEYSNGVRSAVSCVDVARDANGIHMILAARQPIFPKYVGGAEAEFQCIFSEKSYNEATAMIEGFIRTYIGHSSKYIPHMTASQLDFVAEGINIDNKNLGVYERAFFFGKLKRRVEEFNGFSHADRRVRQFPKSPILSMWTNFTVSYASSDDITNYREPNYAMANRIRNDFESLLQRAVQTFTQTGFCSTDMIR